MGSILLTQEGLETSTIEEKSRNESLLNFYMMLDEALKAGDSFYMTEDSWQTNIHTVIIFQRLFI